MINTQVVWWYGGGVVVVVGIHCVYLVVVLKEREGC
jgi:hypothetical protein